MGLFEFFKKLRNDYLVHFSLQTRNGKMETLSEITTFYLIVKYVFYAFWQKKLNVTFLKSFSDKIRNDYVNFVGENKKTIIKNQKRRLVSDIHRF